MQRREDTGKIRIVFFDEAVAFGGSVVVLSHLLRHMDRTRFTPLVVTSLDEDSMRSLFAPEDVLEWFRPPLQYVSRLKWMERCPSDRLIAKKLWSYLFSAAAAIVNLPSLIRLWLKVARARPALIHLNNGNEGLQISRALRIPFVWHLHGISFELTSNTYQGRTRASAFISISKHISAEAIKCGAAAERIVDIPNPAPALRSSSLTVEQWRSKYGVTGDSVVLAHVGRLVRWKGQLEFLDAFSAVASDHPYAVVLIVGDDVEGFTVQYPTEVRRFVKEKGLERRVIFTGHVSNIMELMSFSDVVVHSSIEPEPFGLVIIEAMSAGAAVIAARLGAPLEIVEHGVTGLLVDPKNTHEFAEALALLVQDKNRRKQLAQAGQAAARARYSPELFASRVASVYDKVLKENSGS